MKFTGRCLLLDIEGTTSSIRFVYDEMFPFARREVERYVREHWGEGLLTEALETMARDAGAASLSEWLPEEDPSVQQQRVVDEVHALMDQDAKRTGLKQLQGLVWEAGFASGALRAHVYDDVVPAIRSWRTRGIDVRIYSSGSVHAQKLFFGHTEQGNVLSLFSGHYDTTVGGKREMASYVAIARDMGQSPDEILFISDVVAELDAARSAGLVTALCRRPGNAEPGRHTHPEIHSFADVEIV